MGQIWVKQFSGGLDSRRMPETTEGGALLRATDCHINRGGEIEQRAAFVDLYTLPSGTVGLAYDDASLVVFGSAAEPAGMPAGVRYQRLQHPENPSAVLTGVPSFDRIEKKLFVVGEFDDDTRIHFFDGVAVEWPFDGRARASLLVTGGGVIGGVKASGTITFTVDPSAFPPFSLANILVNGVSVIAPPISSLPTGVSDAAAAIAAAINSATTTPDYTASSSLGVVTITAVDVGVGANGFAISVSGLVGFTVSGTTAFAGGVNGTPGTLSSLTAGAVDLLNGPVSWSTDAEKMAEDIAASINLKTGSTDVSAKAKDARVSLRFETKGATNNGVLLTPTVTTPVTVSPASTTFSGGLASADQIQPGRYVRTQVSKMHAGAGTFLTFSGLNQPTRWTTDITGAGFIDFSKESSAVEDIRAIAPFQQYTAVFDKDVIFIWFLDPDPTLNRKSQVLENAGAASPPSVTQFGDGDLFYLDESGVRSLRARASNAAAATNDVGIPVDTLVQAQLRALTDDERLKCFGLIEPTDGRFWLTMKDKIFVLSSFRGSDVQAWSTYVPKVNVAGTLTLRSIEEAVRFRRKLYFRSGVTIFNYGGADATLDYDATEPEVWLPYLDGGSPALPKELMSLDVACEGEWRVSVGADPTNTAVEDEHVHIWQTTYNSQSIGYPLRSTHFSVRLRGVSGVAGPRKIGALTLHYAGDDKAEQK